MKEQIETGVNIAKQFHELGVLSLDFSARLQKLITNFSQSEIQALTDDYWNQLVPKKVLLEEETAKSLISIVPLLEQIVEVNKFLRENIKDSKPFPDK